MTFVAKCALVRLQATRPNLRTKGFAQALRRALGDNEIAPGFVPDAYRLLKRQRDGEREYMVEVYEIEDTSPLTDAKLKKLLNLWFDLDGDGVGLRILIANRCGRIVDVFGEDLLATWWAATFHAQVAAKGGAR